jgi:hypothetical protein
VFCQTLRLGSGHYRIYLIDPGWLDPAERDVAVRLQLAGEAAATDALTGEGIEIEADRFSLTVPAGSMRVIDVTIH